jgi:predicted metal-dependent hydrolase
MSTTPQSANRAQARRQRGAPDPAGRWHDGAALAYLGGSLRLVLGTRHHEAQPRGRHAGSLPLPPEATPRQIQDRAEAWLREQATRLILEQVIAQKSALAGRRAPRLALSFAARGHWVEARTTATSCAATGA